MSRGPAQASTILMKSLVRLVEPSVIGRRGATRLVELTVQRLQLLRQQLALGDGLSGRPSGAQSFELADDVQQLVNVRASQRRDGESRLLRAGRTDDEALLLQAL
jgi:hypothetical protein